jgi:K+-transporting ATPase ATPase C chain
MLTQLRPAILMFLVLTVITGGVYPLALTGLGQLLFPYAADGSLISNGDEIFGSRLIGQAWSSDKYFWGRPSAAGQGYDAAASSGSNLGPTSQKLMDRIKADADKLRQATGATSIPADAVTASGSGLDPNISPEYALLQVARVAKARGLTEDQVKSMVESHVERPVAGVFGELRVNVLLLNLALDGVNSAANG